MRKRMLAGVTQVLIVEDCRGGETKADGQMATYLGRFRDYPKGKKRYRGPRREVANPLFQLADGSKIWGCECWWKRP